MGIGTSLGAFFEDDFHHIANPWLDTPNSTPDNMEVSPNILEEPEPTLLPVKGVTVLRVPANDNKNLNLGDGIDLDANWAAAKKAFKPSLTIVPK